MIRLLFIITFLQSMDAYAQGSEVESIEIKGGGTFKSTKIPKNMQKLGIAEIHVRYMQILTKSKTVREKKFGGFGASFGKAATGKITSYLEFSDGEITQADCQEITDYFYSYFQKKLKSSGIDTMSWSAITATEHYQNHQSETREEDEEAQKENAWIGCNAHKGNTIYGGKPVKFSAFLKLKKLNKMAESLGGPLLFINTQLNFAELDVETSVNTGGGYKSTWTPTSQNTVTTMKANTKVTAMMHVPSHTTITDYLVDNQSVYLEAVTQKSPLLSNTDYATSLKEDDAKADKKKPMFAIGFSKKLETTPVTITTTKEKYKSAARKALEKYADAFVAKILFEKSK